MGTLPGEVVECRQVIPAESNLKINNNYGLNHLCMPEFGILRVTDITVEVPRMWCARETLEVDDLKKGFEGRARIWRCRISDFPPEWKDALRPRRLPDVDGEWFNANPVFNNRMQTAFPELSKLPADRRRDTPFDLKVTRDEIMPFFYLKGAEPRTHEGHPPREDSEPTEAL